MGAVPVATFVGLQVGAGIGLATGCAIAKCSAEQGIATEVAIIDGYMIRGAITGAALGGTSAAVGDFLLEHSERK